LKTNTAWLTSKGYGPTNPYKRELDTATPEISIIVTGETIK